MAGLIFHVKGVRRWDLAVHEYSYPDRAVGTLSMAAGATSRTIRLAGVLDERWMSEIGGDEIRIVDLGAGVPPGTGRYRLELWSRGAIGTNGSFEVDSFEALLFAVRGVFLARGRGTVLVPDRYPFGERVRVGDDVVVRGNGRPPVSTIVWAVETKRRAAPLPDAPVTLVVPSDVSQEVQVGQEVWLASHRLDGSCDVD